MDIDEAGQLAQLALALEEQCDIDGLIAEIKKLPMDTKTMVLLDVIAELRADSASVQNTTTRAFQLEVLPCSGCSGLTVNPVNRDVAKDAGTTTFSVFNIGTVAMPWILGADLAARFPDGAPAAYTFSVGSPKMFITNVNNSIDGSVKVPIIYSNGLSNFASNSIGARNTIKVTDMSGTIVSSGIAITVTAWDASGKTIAESPSEAPLKLYSHGTTTIAGAALPVSHRVCQ